MKVNTFIFSDGKTMTTKLNALEVSERIKRLDTLIVLTEEFTEGVGLSICGKALRAYNKLHDFTGIIRLTQCEKEFLDYMKEDSFLTSEEIEVINYYTKFNKVR